MIATIDSLGIIHSTGAVAKNICDRSIEDVNLLKSIDKKSISKIKNSYTRLLSNKAGDLSYSLTSFPKTGTINLLVILIDFTDQLSQIGNNNFNNLMNQSNYNGSGSFKDYWLQSSYNGLTVNSTITGWYHAAHNIAYYGANSNGSDINPRLLVQEAVDAAENAGVNFSTYDNDKDGKVDGIIVIHAGYGEEAGGGANTIWSHHWTLESYKRTYDSVVIDDYAIVPELQNNSGSNISNIGVICHEFGHSLGLPDLYDTNTSNGNSEGIGEWGLMGSGNWNNNGASPSILCAWSKIFLNWSTPTILSSECSLLLSNSVQNNIIYQINSPHTNEYFLIENRQRIGFDAGLPGTGLSIWHINTSKTTGAHISANDVNADESLKGVDLEEADGISALDNNTNRGDAGDLFPGNTCNSSFNDNSTPNSQTYSPIVNSSKPITNIMGSGTNIRFDFMGYVPISGPSLVCSSGATFTITKLPSGATVTWSATSTQNNLSINLSTGYAYATNSVTGTGIITAIIHTLCGDITLPTKNVNVGGPATPFITGPATPQCDYTYPYSVDANSQQIGETFLWESDILFIDNPSLKTCTAWAYVDGQGTITCTVTACGVSQTGSRNIFTKACPTYVMTLSPNPTSDIIEITLTDIVSAGKEPSTESMSIQDDVNTSFNIRISTLTGTIVYNTKKDKKKFSIPVNDLLNGNYYIDVSDNKNSYRKQFIVKH